LRLQKAQFRAEINRLLAEKNAQTARAKKRYDEQVAIEEARRPKFRIGGTTGTPEQRLDFANIAVTAASDVTFGSAAGMTKPQHFDVLRKPR
jgi:hypothetical protein